MFIGNHHASWRAFFPWITREGRHSFLRMFRYYTFTGKQISYEVGHNPVAATAYLGISRSAVRQLVGAGQLSRVRLPGVGESAIIGVPHPDFRLRSGLELISDP